MEQYDLTTGRTIAHFESQCAAEEETGINSGGISSCVKGERKSSGGFGWRRPGTAGAAAAGSRKAACSAAATAAKNSTYADIRLQTSRGGVVPRRFQQPDPYNISLSKGTVTSILTLFL